MACCDSNIVAALLATNRRAAIPEELLVGDLVSALGRQVGISSVDVEQANVIMESKLERVRAMRPTKARTLLFGR